MRATITDYRAVQRAEIPLDGITLVAGPNEAGKSSIAQAIAGALTGRALLVPETFKKDAGDVVRDGAAGGGVTVEGPDGSISVAWPSCEIGTRGTPPAITPAAAGLLSIVDLKLEERSAALIKALRAEPTKEALHAKLDANQLGPMTEKIWPLIEGAGWDGATTEVENRTRKLKGEWQGITGEAWGAKKAPGWMPQGYTREANLPLADLEQLVDQARKALEAAISAAAVAGADRAALQAKVDTVPQLETEEKAADREARRLSDAHRDLSLIVPPVPSDPLSCPHCGAFSVLQAGKLVDAGEVTPAAVAAARSHAEAHSKAVEAAKEAFQAAYDKHQDLKRRLVDARQAGLQLSTLPTSSAGTAGDVEAARLACSTAETAFRLANIRTQAEQIQVRIGRHILLASILAPTGLRKETLAAALAYLNRDLAALSDMAGWPRVSINDQSLAVFYGARRYHLISAAAQYRVRATLQVGLARAAGDVLTIHDGADMLDAKGRLGLLKMMKLAGRSALITMTYDAAEKVPDLASKGLGASLWLSGGMVAPVSAPVARAA